MNFILEKKDFYKEDDVVLIYYWYNNMITPVKIIKRIKGKYLVTHKVSRSKIWNAPDEIIIPSEIIDKLK